MCGLAFQVRGLLLAAAALKAMSGVRLNEEEERDFPQCIIL